MIDRTVDMTSLDNSQLPMLNSIISDICTKATSIQYGTTVPAKLDYGVIYIQDDGTDQYAYIKSGDGNIVKLAAITSSGITIPTGGVTIEENTYITFNGATGTTYWIYNSATGYLECHVDGTKRMEV